MHNDSGYELLAYDLFRQYWGSIGEAERPAWRADITIPAADKKHEFASLDLQPSWVEYVDMLGYGFEQWDVHTPDLDRLLRGEQDVVILLSNIMCYCSDDATADLFCALLDGGGVAAIVANERGAEQGICAKLSRRGAVVIKLLDQTAQGRDDRQFVVLPPGSAATLEGVPLDDAFYRVFPNQPYEEKKGVSRA